MKLPVQLAKSKRIKLQYLLLIRRSLTAVPDTSQPPPTAKPSIVTDATNLLLKTPEDEWTSSSQLKELLFPTTSHSPSDFFRITRRFPSSSQALSFFNFLKSNTADEEGPTLSAAFQAVLEIAGEEPNRRSDLLKLYKTCKERKIHLSSNAVARLITYMWKNDMVNELMQVYSELGEAGRTTHIRNVYMQLLFKGGRVDDAFKVLDKMLEKDSDFPANAYTADVIFYWLVHDRSVERKVSDGKMIDLVSRFCAHGAFPNSVYLAKMITKLCRAGQGSQAWDLFHKLMESGAVLEASSCNALLSGLGREGDVGRMNQLMVKMKENKIQPDVFTFGIIINRLCKSYKIDQALEVLENMNKDGDESDVCVEPDVVIYNTLIDGCCKVGRQEQGLKLMEQMRGKGVAPDVVTYNCLIDGFSKLGNIEMGQELFNEMSKQGLKPNNITVNALVDGMCRHGRIHNAVEFIKQMREEGIKGTVVTYTTLIRAFCDVGNIGEALNWFNDMSQNGCSPDAKVYYALIAGLCEAGKMQDASFVASKMKEVGYRLDTVCYNVLIGGFCKKNMLDEALGMFEEMKSARVKPDQVTYNTLISYFSKVRKLSVAHDIIKEMMNNGLMPTVVTYGTLINAHCVEGEVDEAMKIFREMNKKTSKVAPNTVIYNMLIDNLCKNNKVEDALTLMDEMTSNRVKPTATTFNAMFKGLRSKNMLDAAFKLMDEMTKRDCSPDYITMEILTEWLPGAGEIEKLKDFVRQRQIEFPFSPSLGFRDATTISSTIKQQASLLFGKK